MDYYRLNQPYNMPNQLSKSKRRQSLAEHEAVLAALADIARREDTTVMALLREAARNMVKQPVRFKTPAQVARFKRTQREFDRVVLDLQLATPAAVQDRNSLVAARQAVRMINFDQAHAAASS
jgi:hypothetical protein